MRRLWWFLVPVLLSVVVPAAARPRDDALTGAIRCGVIADSRQWLDCYYGAAQPVRAALGLGSALPGQLKLASAPPAGGAPRDEAARDDVVSTAAGCMRQPADRAWLDCYYSAATPMRALLGLAVAGAVARPVLPVPVPAPAPRQYASAAPPPSPSGPPPMPRERGMFSGLLTSAKPIVTKMPMQSYVLEKNGSFTVTLEDGQVWEQAAEDEVRHRARWRRPAGELEVTITPDAMRTYLMTVKDDEKLYKVRRIR